MGQNWCDVHPVDPSLLQVGVWPGSYPPTNPEFVAQQLSYRIKLTKVSRTIVIGPG